MIGIERCAKKYGYNDKKQGVDLKSAKHYAFFHLLIAIADLVMHELFPFDYRGFIIIINELMN